MGSRKLMLALIVGMFLISFASAEIECLPHTQGDNLSFSFSDTLAQGCNVSSIDTPSQVVWISEIMQKTGNTYNATIGGGNFTELGTYTVNLECISGYGNICRNVTEYGINVNLFMTYAGFYMILLIISFWFIYKFATWNGGKVKDPNFYLWAGFLDLIVFVIVEINGFGGSEGLIVDIIKFLALGSGLYFLAQGAIQIFPWAQTRE